MAMQQEPIDWRQQYIYKAYVLGICKGISQLYAHNMFAG